MGLVSVEVRQYDRRGGSGDSDSHIEELIHEEVGGQPSHSSRLP